MEEFETKAISTAANLRRLWMRYIDDTFDTQRTQHRTQFLQHINSIEPDIQCTAEGPNTNRSIHFFPYLLYQGLTIDFSPQCLGNLPTQANTFIGKATTSFLPSAMYTSPLHMEQGLLVPNHSCCKRKRSTFSGPCKSEHISIGY